MFRSSLTSLSLAVVLSAASLLGPVDTAAADSCVCASGLPTYSVDGSLFADAANDFELSTEWLLWCEGGNDPRCSPVQHGSNAIPALADGSTGAMGDPASNLAPAKLVGDADPNEHTRAARAGVSSRVERPPRA